MTTTKTHQEIVKLLTDAEDELHAAKFLFGLADDDTFETFVAKKHAFIAALDAIATLNKLYGIS